MKFIKITLVFFIALVLVQSNAQAQKNGKKSVEPLYWENPLNFIYSEVNAPKRMKLPKPVLADADGDGITDQFDNEPNTPAGSPVDVHGVSRDSDGDGVPDFKDKQLITPTECQPVNADGVGKCPEPECCKNIVVIPPVVCAISDLPSVSFKASAVTLSKDAQVVLNGVADKMKNNPNCKVVVTGYGLPSKSSQQLSWDRVNAVIKYLHENQSIGLERFIFRYGQNEGEPNTVDLKGTISSEEGMNNVPAPHPNLRKK
jgi:outer membrane protein OmpA-like peptidoglycan-associated protein